MAEAEHVRILRLGIEEWNKWRKANRGIIPNLSHADLQGANLQEADLQGSELLRANLRGANLRRADLRGADLLEADLEAVHLDDASLVGVNLRGAFLLDASLQKANLRGANLEVAHLEGAYLLDANLLDARMNGAYLAEANLRGANLRGANLRGADLRGADLLNVNLLDADLQGTRFTSKATLNFVKSVLTDAQLFGCVFLDEEDRDLRNKQAHGKATEELPSLPVVRMHFTRDEWTPELLAAYLLRTQLAFDRLEYLTTTDEQDPEVIWHMVSGRCYRPDTNTIRIAQACTGSFTLELSFEGLGKLFSKNQLKAMTLYALLCGGVVSWDSLEEALFFRAQRHEIEHRAETQAIMPVSDQDQLLPRDLLSAQKELSGSLVLPPEATVSNSTVNCHREAYFSMAISPSLQMLERERERGHSVKITLEDAKLWERRFKVNKD